MFYWIVVDLEAEKAKVFDCEVLADQCYERWCNKYASKAIFPDDPHVYIFKKEF